jgi:hypothetical protein
MRANTSIYCSEPAPPAATIFDVAARLEQNYQKLLSILAKLEGSADSASLNPQRPALNTQISAMAEIRRHIAIAEKALATAVEAHAVEEFQRVVLNALSQAAPAVQRKVLQVLKRRRRPS